MQVTLQGEAKPWLSPNYVIIDIDGKESSIPLSAVDHDTVRSLVQKWTESVYAKAGIK